jgi:multiple sugar transport system substrate-binding protein
MLRRDLLAMLALGFSQAHAISKSSSSGPNYTQFKGQTVVMSVPAHPHLDAMIELIGHFTRETGIKVELDRVDMEHIKGKQLRQLHRPQSDYDVLSYISMWKTEYVAKGLIQELQPFFANPKLSDPHYDFQDLVPAFVENVGLVGGPKGYLSGEGARLYGLPYGAETSIMAYRRDVFDRLGLLPPQTYSQLTALLPLLKDKSNMGALTSRGKSGHQCVHAWLLHLNPLGGRVFDDHWRCVFDQPEGVEALQTLKLIKDTGPSDIAYFGQGEMVDSFIQGQSSLYIDSTLIFSLINKQASRKLKEKFAFALHPKGLVHSSESGGLGLALASHAKNPEAAFLLIQWLTSKAQDKAVCQLGGLPARLSTVKDPSLSQKMPELALLAQQLKYINADWRPIIAQWDAINVEELGVAVFQGMNGEKPPFSALNDVAPTVSQRMLKAGYTSL